MTCTIAQHFKLSHRFLIGSKTFFGFPEFPIPITGFRTGFDRSPEVYLRKYIEAGYYDVEFLEWGFNWIQQESTIWKRVLWDRCGGLDLAYKYAADFHLWQNFARHADMVRVQSFIGGFRVHGDQITANPGVYRAELSQMRRPPEGLKTLQKRSWCLQIHARNFWKIVQTLELYWIILVLQEAT